MLLLIAVFITVPVLCIQLYRQGERQSEEIQSLTDQVLSLQEKNDALAEQIQILQDINKNNADKLTDLQLHMDYSFYQKLAEGIDVNILIVGDSISAGGGASDGAHAWPDLLAAGIREKYGIDTTLTNISMGGNTSYAGYVRTMLLDDDIDYDLAVLCYGQNDSPENFSLYYESLIFAVQKKCPHASIICILESSQREYTEKMQIIQELALHYGLPTADTIAPFQSDYDNLVCDGIHPNDAGHQVYSDVLMGVIDSLAENGRGHDPSNVISENDCMSAFDNLVWLDGSRFTREGNTFTLNTAYTGTVLGIDYDFTPGKNKCVIFIDNGIYAAPEEVFNEDFRLRHIIVANDWLNGNPIHIKNEIKVVFENDEAGTDQADSFRGLIISR